MLPNQGVKSLVTLILKQGDQGAGQPNGESGPRRFSARIAAPDFDSRQRQDRNPAGLPNIALPAAVKASVVEARLSQDQAASMAKPPTIDRAPVQETLSGQPHRSPPQVALAPAAATLENNAAQAPSSETRETTYSTILGQITLQRNETLSRIIIGIYGGFNSKYFKSFIIANPDIEDPDRVDVGQIISLPAIPARVKPLNTPVWWIKIDDRDSLATAFNLLRNHLDRFPAVRLIPYWNPSDGTRFALLLEKLFTDEMTARQHLQQLPAELASNSIIVSRWKKETVYFSNPYFN
jgi:hypothetical protein